MVQIDMLIALPETTDSRHQPKRGKRGCRRNRHVRAVYPVAKFLAQLADLLK